MSCLATVPITDRAALVFHREVILAVRDRVRQAVREGKTLEQVRDAKLTADFEARVAVSPHSSMSLSMRCIKSLKAESDKHNARLKKTLDANN
jgi:hypothetical protein